MKKVDYKKQELKDFYTAKQAPKFVNVPEIKYILIPGEGNPNSSKAFQDAVETLYSVSYGLKFMIKKNELPVEQIDFKVMPLEGQWYMDDMSRFSMDTKDEWKWNIMIGQPGFLTKELLGTALKKITQKKELKSLDKLKLVSQTDGLSAQLMHTGPYSEEGPTVQKLHNFVEDNGYRRSGLHREIYLSDSRRAASEKLKTIIRQPIEKKS